MFLILSESLNLIGCQGDKVLSFVKYSKIFSKTIKGMKLILCIHDIYIILYINCFLFYLYENWLPWQRKVSFDL